MYVNCVTMQGVKPQKIKFPTLVHMRKYNVIIFFYITFFYIFLKVTLKKYFIGTSKRVCLLVSLYHNNTETP